MDKKLIKDCLTSFKIWNRYFLAGAIRRILCGPSKIRRAKTEFVRTIRISRDEEAENHWIASKQPSSKDGDISFTE